MERKYFTLLILFVFLFLLSCGNATWENLDFALSWGVSVEDIDGDGTSDIAVAAEYVWDAPDGYEDYYATVILNSTISPGDFFPEEEYDVASGDNFYLIAIGDLNDDGHPDIVTQDWRSIYILFQDSVLPGNFLNPVKIVVDPQVDAMAIGDLNEDGFNDIAIAGFTGPHLSILFQDSTNPGNFLPIVSIGLSSNSVAIADLDGDFINDMAVTGGGKVKLLFQDPGAPGNFFAPVELDAGTNPADVKIGDLDKDGNPDLVVGNTGSTSWFDGSVSVLIQDSANPGDFLPADNYNFSCDVSEIDLGDLNDDGFLDISADGCSDDRSAILFQDISSAGTFLLPATKYSWGYSPWSVVIGDMNNDNFNDLIASADGVEIRWQDPAAPGTFATRTTIYVLD